METFDTFFFCFQDSKRKSRDSTTLTDNPIDENTDFHQEHSSVKISSGSYQVSVTGQRSVSPVEVSQGQSNSTAEVDSEHRSDSVIETSKVVIEANGKVENSETFSEVNDSKEKSVITTEVISIPVSSIPDSSVKETNSQIMSEFAENSTSQTGSHTEIDNKSTNAENTENQSTGRGTNTEQGAESPVRMRKKSSNPDLEIFKGM